MKLRLENFWESLRSTYWFLPSLLALSSVVLAIVTIRLDRTVQNRGDIGLQWLYAGSADGAQSLLSTVAGSMMTVAGVTFSVTIVALTLASSQFGPRLLSSFMRDLGNQLVLGTYIATFIFCVLIMRTIYNTDEIVFVPPISVTVALLLAILSLGVLIYFIHHISTSINVEYVIAKVEQDLNAAIEHLYPQQWNTFTFEGELRREDDIPEDFEEEARPVPCSKSGYVHTVDTGALLKAGIEHEALLRLELRPGDFVAEGNALALILRTEGLDDELVETINDAFIIGQQRLQLQDVEYMMNQLVEIALRALSPGINDPFTAMACVDRLGATLSRLAERTIPSSYHYDEDGTLRLIGEPVTFEKLVNTAFDQIRQYGRTSVSVTIHLLETIAVVGGRVHSETERRPLRRQATMIRRGAGMSVPEANDRRDIEAHYQLALKMLS